MTRVVALVLAFAALAALPVSAIAAPQVANAWISPIGWKGVPRTLL